MTEQEKLIYLTLCWERWLRAGGDPTVATTEWCWEAE
jgi:hypothetical protein